MKLHKTIHDKRAITKLFADTKEQSFVRYNLSKRCIVIDRIFSIRLGHFLEEDFWHLIDQDCRKIFVSFYRNSEWSKITMAKASLLEELSQNPGDNAKKFLKLKELMDTLERAV